ncbi:hypothetical protein, partial [Acetobacter okinawensis]|uniref:hypothetical protein n=1 Tax=Acetobacter okinawensis TaxID=1076594 RepID=UPI001A7F03E4
MASAAGAASVLALRVVRRRVGFLGASCSASGVAVVSAVASAVAAAALLRGARRRAGFLGAAVLPHPLRFLPHRLPAHRPERQPQASTLAVAFWRLPVCVWHGGVWAWR